MGGNTSVVACTNKCFTVELRDNDLARKRTFARATFEATPLGEGSCRFCYKGLIHSSDVERLVPGWNPNAKPKKRGDRANTTPSSESVACVVKVLKGTHAMATKDVMVDVASLQIARRCAAAFNRCQFLDKKIVFPEPLVAQVTEQATGRAIPLVGGFADQRYRVGEYVTLEPYLGEGYGKYNNNGGWMDPTVMLPQVFSHFSYHISDGAYIVCDLQGIRTDDAYHCTDPALHSLDNKFGSTDFGPLGMLIFFRSHKCNAVCERFKKPTLAAEARKAVARIEKAAPKLAQPHTAYVFETAHVSQNPRVQKACRNVLEGHALPADLKEMQRIVAELPV